MPYVILYSVQCCYAVHWTDNDVVQENVAGGDCELLSVYERRQMSSSASSSSSSSSSSTECVEVSGADAGHLSTDTVRRHHLLAWYIQSTYDSSQSVSMFVEQCSLHYVHRLYHVTVTSREMC